jgi:glycerate-2-kinase
VKSCCITIPYGITIRNKLCTVTHASHPIPDSNGVLGTERILQILEKVKKNEFVVMFLSGGASALMPLPIDIIKLKEKQNVTKKLLSSGATIDEINTVRKHLSKVKGGRLAEIVNRRFSLLTLILSDVVNDKIDVIASGPTVPDLTTFEDAKKVLVKYKIWNNNKIVSNKLRKLISDGISGYVKDTPKPGNRILITLLLAITRLHAKILNYF